MKTVDYVTVNAAHKFAAQEQGKKPTAYIKLGEVQTLCVVEPCKTKKQHWSFFGDWKKSVAPWYNEPQKRFPAYETHI
jgi:hypothetical protein